MRTSTHVAVRVTRDNLCYSTSEVDIVVADLGPSVEREHLDDACRSFEQKHVETTRRPA